MLFRKNSDPQAPEKSGKTNKNVRLVTSIDVGTSKIVCLIASYEDNVGFKLLGYGHQASRGVRRGEVIDSMLCQSAIGQAIQAAEQSARRHLNGVPIESMTINVASKGTLLFPAKSHLNLKGQDISSNHIGKILNQCNSDAIPDSQEVIHKIPLGFSVDGGEKIENPEGILADTLDVETLQVTSPSMPIRNLAKAVEENHIEIDRLCNAAYASGLGCLVRDEREMGAVLIDIGAGTSDISIFSNNKLLYAGAVPLGGNHITSDIAKGLTTPVAYAERIKTLYGSAISSPIGDRDMIEVPLVGDNDIANVNHVPRSILLGIIRPRLEEMFEMIRAQIDDSGLREISGRRAVLTGGTSELPGIADFAAYMLDKQVRLAKPMLDERINEPSFSTAVGLLHYTVFCDHEAPHVYSPYSAWSIFDQLRHWVKENW